MTFRGTVMLSIFFHSLVVYVALLCVRNIPLPERTIFVELKTPSVEDHAGKGEALKHAHTEARVKSPKPLASAPRRKKPAPASQNVRESDDAKTDEMVKEQTEEPETGEQVSSSAGGSDLMQGGGKGAGQGGSEPGTEGMSVYLNGTGDGSSNSSSGSGSRDGNAIGQIRESIERVKIYPDLARRRRQEGMVVMEFSINAKGLPETIRVTKSSGFSLLDSAARDTIFRAAPFPVVKGRIEVPINFILK